MKKLHFIIAMLLTTVCCMALFAACSHEHTFAEEWSKDENSHWHAATCQHTAEKSDNGAHTFDGGVETAEGTKFTCTKCGYFEIRPSRYRVTADEYANLLGAVEKFRVDMDHDGLHTYRIISDVVFLASQGVSEYYCFVGNDLVCLVKYYDQEEYIEEKRDKKEYDSVKSNSNLLGYIADKFALLTYNLESKTYDAESLLIEEQGEYWAKFNDLSVSFEDGKLVSVKFIFALNTGAYTETAYEYSEIGTASAQFPETWHKHTYSEEWSSTKYSHWHDSTCGHDYAMKDNESHTFNEAGVCTVCRYSVFELSEDGKTLIKFTDNNIITSVTIPEGVTTIGEKAFYECWYLTSVVFPKSLTSIGNYAFSGCGKLTEVTLPEGVTEVGERAFSKGAYSSLMAEALVLNRFHFINCISNRCCFITTTCFSPKSKCTVLWRRSLFQPIGNIDYQYAFVVVLLVTGSCNYCFGIGVFYLQKWRHFSLKCGGIGYVIRNLNINFFVSFYRNEIYFFSI